MGFIKKIVKKAVKTVTKTTSIVGAAIGAVTGIGAVAGIVGSTLLNNSSSSSSTKTGAVTTVSNDLNVYIPQQDIPFNGNLFKPNTRLYVFFDGKSVDQYIQPDGQTVGAPLITDAAGRMSGVFHLPCSDSIKFTQGKKELRFSDSSKNDRSESTYGSAYFTYAGSADNTETQDIGGSQDAEVTSDPVVQTFTVLDSGGIFLKKVDLFFMKKDSKWPVLLQIREVKDGVVSSSYLTNSNVVLYPDNIAVSTTGEVATTVVFSNPVYLQEGKEYGIYLLTNAPATYSLATCVYGEMDIYNRLSTRDPRLGGLLKNVGESGWLKDTSRGLKFITSKCSFDTTHSYTLALDNENLLTHFLKVNSLSTTISTNIITVIDEDHSFNPGDYVTISGLPDSTSYGGISTSYINGVHKIDSVTVDSYTFSTYQDSGIETVIPQTANASVMFGTNVITDTSYQYDVLLVNSNEIRLSNTDLIYTYKGLSGKSLDGSETPNVFDATFTEITNGVDYNTSKVKKVNSGYNEMVLNPGGEKSLQVNVNFRTNNPNISPILTVSNANAILVENVINNRSDNETTDQNPKGVAKYITKEVKLSAQSNGVQVRFSANIQGSANVKIYYKVLPVVATDSIDNYPWVEMTLDNEVSKANNDSTYNDYQYTAYDVPLFKTFMTKVLMLSPDSTKVPLIKCYRAIAFQSIDNE